MKLTILPILLSLLQSATLMAAELTPFLKDKKLGVTIREVKFPETLIKDLTSGLTNKILIRVWLGPNLQSITQKVIDMTIKYDLWDETFKVTMTVEDEAGTPKIYPNTREVMAFLANLKLPNLFASGELMGSKEIVLKADVLLNPIERERMEKIRKWVAQNSTTTPLDPTGFSSSKPVAASRSNIMFNKIFEQYVSGTTMAAAWKESLSSKPFKLGDVPNEK